MNVRQIILFILVLGCALFVQSAIAATIVAASDASAASKATAQYICDGSNDQVELNNALARGGEIVMTEGTFRTSGTISVPGNCIFRGQGPEKTVIAMAGDYAARVDISKPTVTVSNFKITQRGWLMITTSHVKVHDVTIQDSKKTAPTVNGMFFVWASNTVCEDIEFIRCKAIDVGSTGFNLNGQGTPRTNRNIRFDDCLALRCGNAGSGKIWAVGFDFHEGADLYDLVVTDCRAEDCWESGFYFEPNFVNGNDPNKAVPVQVNSRVSNCVAVNNGWRNTEPTRFYMTGFYLSCGVTLNNCVSVNSRNNGFWLWQNSKDITLNSCTDDGSTNSYQVRSGTNLRFYNCISKNADVYALYMWGTSGAIFDDFKIINPKKTSGAVSLGLREDHPNDPWPVTGCTFDILLSGADPNTLIRYYNANNNKVTINGYTPVDEDNPEIPTISVNTSTPTNTTPVTNEPVEPGEIPDAVGKGVAPGIVECENYDAGGEGQAYHDTTPGNEGGDYRQDDVDIEYSSATGSHVVGYNRPGEWLQYTINVTQAMTYDVTFRVASPNTGTSFKLSVDGVEKATYSVPDTDNWYTFRDVTKPVALTAGKHVIRITTTGYHNLDRMTFSIPGQTPGPTPTPTVTLTATPTVTMTAAPPIQGGAAIPGLIEAENYNTGGEGVAYHDVEAANLGNAQTYRPGDGVDLETATSEGGVVVAWVRPGEWLKYSVNVAESTVYDVSFRVSTPRTDGSFKMQVDGADVCTVMVPNTGDYNTYQTVVRQVLLPAGGHTIRLYFNGYTNVNWVRFIKSTINVGPTPTPEVPPPIITTPGQGISLPAPIPVSYGSGIIPGTVQAEDFNTGGEGVGYYDTTASNIGGVYRNEDVDIELGDTKDEPVVCYVRPGEWLKYTVNVRGTGDYDVVFRVASPQANTQIKLQVDGVTATTITVPNTGSYNTYANVTQRIRLTWGPHVLRLMLGGYHNINYVAFGPAGSMTASSALDPVVTDATTALPTPTGTTLPTVTPGVTPPANATPPANVTPPVTTTVPTPTLNTTATVTAAVAPTTNATTPTSEPTTPAATVTIPETAVPTTTTVADGTATAGETTVPTTVAPVTATTLETPALPTPAPTLTATVTATPSSPPQKTAPGGPGAPAPTATVDDTTVVPTSVAPATPTVTVAETTATAEPAITETTPTETVPGQTLAELASTDANLSTFVNVVEETGLVGLLDGAGPYTVFAPTNEAFDALPPGALEQLRADPARLAEILGYHVAEEEYSVSDLAAMPEIATLDGLTATVAVQADGSLEVQGARLNRTDIPASNGVLHVIDAVMWPPGMDLTPTTAAPSPTATDPLATTAVPAVSTDPTATANATVAEST